MLARDRNRLEPQGVGERQGAVADIDVVQRIAHPGRFDLRPLYLRVRQRFLEGLDHEIFGTLVPMFAERRAAHADDRDLVLDPARHRSNSERWAFRRRGLPEISAEATSFVARLDPEPHPNAISHGKPARVRVGEFHHHPRAVVELGKAEPEWRVGRVSEPGGRDGDDSPKLIRGAQDLKQLGPLGVGPYRDAALGELQVAFRVARADEADRVSPVELEYRRLRLLFELRTDAPIEFKRAVEAEETYVIVEDKAAAESLGRRVRARHRPGHLEDQRVAAAAEAGEQQVVSSARFG